MRSPREILFRARQEAANYRLFLAPPEPRPIHAAAPLSGLPDPQMVADRLRDTAFAREVERLAGMVLEHRFLIFGREVSTGPQIDWRRDYRHDKSTGLAYFRRIPYLDFARAGDHKEVWEVNRHQHLVLLAQAFRFTGGPQFLDEIWREIESWWDANPFMRGINWASALEVGFRSLSWVWVYHLAGDRMTSDFRRRFLMSLYQHGCYLEKNLSIYFSPNTHLLGEALALHALGLLFPDFPSSSRWERDGAAIVAAQMDTQVRQDGSHFEQSSYYHVYALDMFLLHAALLSRAQTPLPADYENKLKRMLDYLGALVGQGRVLPFLGDDDGGRLFHPYGRRECFARATLATGSVVCGGPDCSCEETDFYEQAYWWFGIAGRAASIRRAESQLFPDAGMAVLRAGPFEVVADAGPFGPGSAGHSHSDTLSILVRFEQQQILIDPGTYTYLADPRLRDWFRGSAAHNTVRVDKLDQGIPAGPFRWRQKPSVELLNWTSSQESDMLGATCRYAAAGIVHRRRMLLLKQAGVLFVHDSVEGPATQQHLVEQFWHWHAPPLQCAPGRFQIGQNVWLIIPISAPNELIEGQEHGWRSFVFADRTPACVLRVYLQCALPAELWTVFDFSKGVPGDLKVSATGPVYERSGRKIIPSFQEMAT